MCCTVAGLQDLSPVGGGPLDAHEARGRRETIKLESPAVRTGRVWVYSQQKASTGALSAWGVHLQVHRKTDKVLQKTTKNVRKTTTGRDRKLSKVTQKSKEEIQSKRLKSVLHSQD